MDTGEGGTTASDRCFTSAAPIPPATYAPGSVAFVSVSSTLSAAASCPLSRSERRFIEDGIFHSHRLDGRSLLDFRPVSVKIGVLPSAFGSSRVRTGDSELVVGVKCEIVPIVPGQPQNKGIIICSVDCSASLNLDMERRGGQDAGLHLAQLVQYLCLGPTAIDRTKLCIVEGKLAWKIFVDVVVLNGAGSLLDSISIGVRAALLDTKLPLVDPVTDVDETTGEEKLDFTLDHRPELGRPFPAEDIPICVTVGQVRDRFVWDLTPEEETCSTARLTVAIDALGKCRGFHKSGEAPLRLDACLIALKNSCRVGQLIHRQLFTRLNENSTSPDN